jgi:hypothetical protein
LNGNKKNEQHNCIPSVTGSEIPALKRITSWINREVKIWDSKKANVTSMDYFPSTKACLPNLGDYKIMNACKYIINGMIDYGNIEYDYLKTKNTIANKEISTAHKTLS